MRMRFDDRRSMYMPKKEEGAADNDEDDDDDFDSDSDDDDDDYDETDEF